ncbi:MAG: AAA family ATPase, partial [Faecalicoccus sp.]|nr:AAA family ATPase [Faecalicoccus sp.]
MLYLKSLELPNDREEYDMILYKKNIHNTLYPLNIFPQKELEHIDFEPITIFYGGNGSGKTTLLNIIGDTIQASRRKNENRSDLFHK